MHADMEGLAYAWLSAIWRASWQGGLVLLLVWGLTRCWRSPLSPRLTSFNSFPAPASEG